MIIYGFGSNKRLRKFLKMNKTLSLVINKL